MQCLLLPLAAALLLPPGCEGGPQSSPPAPLPGPPAAPAPAQRQSLVLTTMDDPLPVRRRLAEWGVEAAILMGGHFIDNDNTATWEGAEIETTRAWLDEHVPNAYNGFLVLDWESNAMRILRRGTAHPQFRQTLGEYAKLAQWVKRQRPAAKVGFYNLPITEYWKQDEAWESAMRDLQPIIDACDAVFPSLYDFYAIRPERDMEKFSRVVSLALELARGKPVLLFIQHRYHNSTSQSGFKLIPAAEMTHHIKTLMQVEVGGRRPAGVVLWGADRYYQRTGLLRHPDGRYRFTGDQWDRIRKEFAAEMAPGESADAYLGRLYPRVYETVARAVRGSE